MIWTVAKKELRGYFNSAVAVLFLLAFLAVALYTFFWTEKFFARGLADLRPLFEWMPILLIILVSALAMRLWADERRAGTLELLLTLPVPRWKLVVGKFIAGMVLIAIGLGLTLGLPITVAQMGDLDMGPVFGGYLAALLLSGAYLSIGMCVSAATDNQIIAFIGTAFACTVAYAVGEVGSSDLARLLGTGTRFDSVARGVLDLRDLAYYGGIMVTGVAVNVLLLGLLTWSPKMRPRRAATMLGVGLIAANALALNLWLAPLSRVRIDLTEDGAYSLSDSTKKIVNGLDERLLIRAYVSEKTHPLLAPVIPQLKDLLEEYRIIGGANVRVEVIDPLSDDAKREAKERFSIEPSPIPFADEMERSIVNVYFSVAIEYGDQHEILGINDLVTRGPNVEKPEVLLRNPEYAITKSIKKAVAGFSSIDTLFAAAAGPIKLTAYLSPKTLPDNWKDAPEKLKQIADELTKQSGGKFTYTTVVPKLADGPKTDAERAAADAEARQLLAKYGVRGFSDILSGNIYYFNLILEIGNRIVPIPPPEAVGDAALKTAITDGLKRGAPGFRKVVGLWSPPGAAQQVEGMPPQQGQPPQTFQLLQRALAGSYEVRAIQLAAKVPDDVDVLVLGGPANLDAKSVESVDQFVMRGGSLVVLAGRYRLVPAQGLGIEKVTTGLEPLFTKWGIKLGDELVLDTKNDPFPIPNERDLGNGMMVREFKKLPYPFFVRLEGGQLAGDSVITSGVPSAVLHWPAAVSADAKVGDDAHTVVKLLESSSEAWLSTSTEVQPDLEKYPDAGFPGPGSGDKRGRQTLAVAVTGGFASGVAKPPADKADKTAQPQRLLEHSPPDTRIVVFGSSSFLSDVLIGSAQELQSNFDETNIQLVHNAVDWAVADTDLLGIRAHNSAARALTVEPDARNGWRIANIVIALLALGAIVAAAWLRRRAVTPVITPKEA